MYEAQRTPRRRPSAATIPIGWREWVALPGLNVPRIKAKIDTGARTSALHASRIRRFERDGVPMVRFEVHPYQRDASITVQAEAPLVDERRIRSSNGQISRRPVIVAEVEIMGKRRTIELTLIGRDAMGFRMLLGRQALRGRFLVDAGRSYLGGRPERRTSGPRRARSTKRRRQPSERAARQEQRTGAG